MHLQLGNTGLGQLRLAAMALGTTPLRCTQLAHCTSHTTDADHCIATPPHSSSGAGGRLGRRRATQDTGRHRATQGGRGACGPGKAVWGRIAYCVGTHRADEGMTEALVGLCGVVRGLIGFVGAHSARRGGAGPHRAGWGCGGPGRANRGQVWWCGVVWGQSGPHGVVLGPQGGWGEYGPDQAVRGRVGLHRAGGAVTEARVGLWWVGWGLIGRVGAHTARWGGVGLHSCLWVHRARWGRTGPARGAQGEAGPPRGDTQVGVGGGMAPGRAQAMDYWWGYHAIGTYNNICV